MHDVESSNLKAVGYNAATSTLLVEFKNTTVYEYADVPLDIFDQLIAAESVGQAFHKLVKIGGFIFKKLELTP
jgi:hypothetical protein